MDEVLQQLIQSRDNQIPLKGLLARFHMIYP